MKFNQSIRFWSLLTGWSLILMALVAGFAYGVSFQSIYIESSTQETLNNIQENKLLFHTGILAWGLILVLDVIVSIGTVQLVKAVDIKLAIITGLLRVVYSIILGVGILYMAVQSLNQFLHLWSLGLVLFGFHLIALGKGVCKNKKTPKIFGILLTIAGLGYIIVHGMAEFSIGSLDLQTKIESILLIPMTIGELAFALWLVIKGGK